MRDRNRITGAGVTSGIDFALNVVAEIAGNEQAQAIQLQMEYDPEPPYSSGSPRTATPALVARVREQSARFIERRRQATLRAAQRLESRNV
ncbi:hypothetical protein K5Q02_15625 [Pseudomonas sp. MM211]|uniref:hypothetical protein n=1 Tax=Pseudomonas sp. MM211 TaxID=2866808 RepID=UPI001CEC6E09|nr:hypothetical protein [Pseudomonas sp. MM211]UCJ15285.1 hypothetical protein K5Q02_15625 [Pseudomonas sp. MM211]